MKFQYLIFYGCVLMNIISCVPLNSTLDCPQKNSISCKSLSETDALLYKQANKNQNIKQDVKNEKERQENKILPNSLWIWIASYKDSEGNLHFAHSILSKNMTIKEKKEI